MAFSSNSSGGAMSDMNVTPLVDVMLVLLIIFMVTAPLLVTGVPVELPESRANALDQKDEPIEIAIDKDGVTFIDGTEVGPADLPVVDCLWCARRRRRDPAERHPEIRRRVARRPLIRCGVSPSPRSRSSCADRPARR